MIDTDVCVSIYLNKDRDIKIRFLERERVNFFRERERVFFFLSLLRKRSGEGKERRL